ncbi:MAG: hypothetical protein JO257_28375 [Deltaproteobacteria bacterium]|nr:hypothetical protein [Deltaproteobacteria bacterium]
MWTLASDVGWSGCSRWDGATWTSYGCDAQSISGTSANDVWLGGSGGLMHWNGSSLNPIGTPITTITKVIAVTPTNIWITDGARGFTYDGTSFTPTGTPGRPTPPSTTTDLWLGNDHWDGTTWSTFPACPSTQTTSTSFNSTQSAWCVGRNSVVMHYDGASWQSYPGRPPELQANPAVLYATTGTVLSVGVRYSDGVQILADRRNVLMWSDGNVDGQWTDGDTIPFPVVHNSQGAYAPAASQVFTFGGSEVWAVGLEHDPKFSPECSLLHEKNGTWSTVSASTSGATDPDCSRFLLDIKGSGANDVWIALSNRLLHWDGTALQQMRTDSFISLWSPAPGQIWGMTATTLYAYDGTSWSTPPMPSISGGTSRSLWGSSTSDVWWAGGTCAHFNGSTWTYVASCQGSTGVWGLGPTDYFFVGADFAGGDIARKLVWYRGQEAKRDPAP